MSSLFLFFQSQNGNKTVVHDYTFGKSSHFYIKLKLFFLASDNVLEHSDS
jgi:hypothetical protein